MDEGCRNHLDDGKNADLKHHLLHQIIVFQKRIGAIVQCLAEIKPGHQTRCQKQHKGNLHAASKHRAAAAKYFIKHHIIHQHRHHRLGHGPHRSQIGACVTLFKVIFCKLPDQMPVLKQLHRQGGEFVIPFRKNNAGG